MTSKSGFVQSADLGPRLFGLHPNGQFTFGLLPFLNKRAPKFPPICWWWPEIVIFIIHFAALLYCESFQISPTDTFQALGIFKYLSAKISDNIKERFLSP